ncbi:MAG: hypothetical protein R3F34_17865 [Planctomycetota bacterium]
MLAVRLHRSRSRARNISWGEESEKRSDSQTAARSGAAAVRSSAAATRWSQPYASAKAASARRTNASSGAQPVS